MIRQGEWLYCPHCTAPYASPIYAVHVGDAVDPAYWTAAMPGHVFSTGDPACCFECKGPIRFEMPYVRESKWGNRE